MLTLQGLLFLAFLQIDTLLNCLAVKGKYYNSVKSNRIPQDDTPENHFRLTVEDVSFRVPAPPRKKHLRQKRLKRILGRDLNLKFVSIEKPHSLEIENKLKRFNNISITDDGKLVQIDASLKHNLELWLPKQGKCEIMYEWEDLGMLFWPRWIKRGHCDTSMSCSIPAGMHCVPTESKTITILRWHCQTKHLEYKKKHRHQGHVGLRHKSPRKRTRKDRNKGASGKVGDSKKELKQKRRRQRNAFRSRGMNCKWLKVPYPVTSDCFCSC